MAQMLPRIVLAAAGLLSIQVSVVVAADVSEPVRRLMAVAGWTGEGAPKSEADDYFAETLLGSIYSESFVDVYRVALKVDELSGDQGYMTGYDVVIGGQDSCPLKDVRVEALPPVGAVTPVAVYFDAVSCWGHVADLKTPQTIFHVIEENGRPVIDNFWNDAYRNGAVETSVKAEYANLSRAFLEFRVTGSWPKD